MWFILLFFLVILFPAIPHPTTGLMYYYICKHLLIICGSFYFLPNFKKKIYLFVVVSNLGCGHVGSSSLTREQTWALLIGSMESQPHWTTGEVPPQPFILKKVQNRRKVARII